MIRESARDEKIKLNFKKIITLFRTDGRESPVLTESDADHNSDKPRVKYGELVILG